MISEVTMFDACALVALRGTGAENRGHASHVLSPFDRLEPHVAARRLRRVRPRTWRRQAIGLLSEAGGPATLRTAGAARMNLLPHQLAPALAIVKGHGSRVLIADEVGLGKTVQAGLIVAELMARGAAARALILCPAGLRDQWVDECRDRFALGFRVFDAASIRRHRRELPAGVNPWSTQPLVAASMDFVKRPEVLAAVRRCHWDVVVVDEAHHTAAGNDRHGAVAALCGSASYVVLLTATPHNGDARAFTSLCAIGTHGDRLVTFRRTRLDIGARDDRRVHRLRVGTTDHEHRMHRALASFSRAVGAESQKSGSDNRRKGMEPAAALAVATLRKRAFSSAFALARSVERRLRALAGEGPEAFEQLTLPLDDESGREGLDAADEPPEWTAPSLADPAVERTLLSRVLDAARLALGTESKLLALERLLRRLQEPALVFTEYRDTLLYVRDRVAPGAAVIHGGLSTYERRRSLDQFAAGGVLLATDAAGEGLNLQHRCRVVVNLELPWSPVRLEQRIGRVDRIGQQRRVHVFHLIAAGTGEGGMLTRLARKVAQAHGDIAAANPLHSRRTSSSAAEGSLAGTGTSRNDAADEASRLHHLRQLTRAMAGPRSRGASPGPADVGTTLVARSTRSATRAQLYGRALVVMRTAWVDRTGRVAAVDLKPLLVRLHAGRTFDLLAIAVIESVARQEPFDPCTDHRVFWATRVARERALAQVVRANGEARQRGLFDLRADRGFDNDGRLARESRRVAAQRIRTARNAMRLEALAQVVLVLLP